MLKIQLPYAPAIPLLGTCPKEMKTYEHVNTYTQIFTAAFIPEPKCGNKFNVHQLMNGLIKYGLPAQCSIIW